MTQYNYLDAMTDDIIQYIKDNHTNEEITENLQDRSQWADQLNDYLFNDDSVTGNASCSYTFNTYEAEEYIAHNLDLLTEALREFGDDLSRLEEGAETCDVIIRCYLLYQAIGNALDEIEEEYEQ